MRVLGSADPYAIIAYHQTKPLGSSTEDFSAGVIGLVESITKTGVFFLSLKDG